MPENATASDFAMDVAWVVGVVIVSTIAVSVVKKSGRKIRSFRKA